MTTLKIIEGQEDYFKKEFVGVIPDIDPFIIDEATPEKILNWHKQSIIQIISAEIERKRVQLEAVGEPQGFSESASWSKGRKEALEEDITHLTVLLDSLK